MPTISFRPRKAPRAQRRKEPYGRGASLATATAPAPQPPHDAIRNGLIPPHLFWREETASPEGSIISAPDAAQTMSLVLFFMVRTFSLMIHGFDNTRRTKPIGPFPAANGYIAENISRTVCRRKYGGAGTEPRPTFNERHYA
jgi:hypothetical protein